MIFLVVSFFLFFFLVFFLLVRILILVGREIAVSFLLPVIPHPRDPDGSLLGGSPTS